MPIKQYIEQKLQMLEIDFRLSLSEQEIAHMRSLKTENSVNAYAYYLLQEKL